MTTPIQLIDAETAVRIEDDNVVFKRTQHIDPHFLASLSDERAEQDAAPMGNFVKAASIPTIVVEKWLAEGFNIFDPSVGLPAIMKRLAAEDMDRLITTNKRLY